jgi:acylphosphatase
MTMPGGPRRRVEVVVRGRVQGVGYRFHAVRAAERHGIVGRVANERGGTVRAIGEGPEADLQAWIAELRAGPAGASVERVDETWAEASGGFEDFDVRSSWTSGD